jgi:hypothetical protein
MSLVSPSHVFCSFSMEFRERRRYKPDEGGKGRKGIPRLARDAVFTVPTVNMATSSIRRQRMGTAQYAIDNSLVAPLSTIAHFPLSALY